MAVFIFALKSILPLFVPMLLGYLIRLARWVSQQSLVEMNRLVFKTLLPLMIFMNMIQTNKTGKIEWQALVFGVAAVLIIFGVSWFGVARTVKYRPYRGMIVQGLYRSNFVLFGTPLVESLFSGTRTGVNEMLIAVIIPLYNVLAVFILQYYAEGDIKAGTLLKNILKNPLIIACVAGLLFKYSGLTMPRLLLLPLNQLAAAATPLALIVLGGQFFFRSSHRYRRYLAAVLPLKLLVFPGLILGLAYALGFRGEALIAFLALFASPVAVSSYTMAQSMCKDAELAGQLLVYSSIFCAFSLLIFITIGRSLGIF